MAFDSDACRVDDDGGAVGCYGLLRALRVIWRLQLNSFQSLVRPKKKSWKSMRARRAPQFCWDPIDLGAKK
jgi:hypothetical protein